MKPIKYPETIFCADCQEHVKMTNCRLLPQTAKSKIQVEFDYACVTCGQRNSAVRDLEFLQFSEREFCQKNGIVEFKPGSKKMGGIYEKRPLGKTGKMPVGKYG